MQIRTIRAATARAALAALRAELGPDALVLATRESAGQVEVTAAIETGAIETGAIGTGAANEAAASARPCAERAALLAAHGVPPALALRLSAGPLPFALSAALRFGRLDATAPLLVAGPPGAGKTLTIARLATRMVLAGQRPAIVTADGRRAGAIEQMTAYTRLLGLALESATTPQGLARTRAVRQGGAAVLIDTPGFDLMDSAERDEAAALAEAAGARMALVLPAGGDAAECAELAAAAREAGATVMIATRLDLARRLGGVLAAAASGLSLVEAGVGPGAADGLVACTPALLARRLAQPPGARVAA